MPRKKIAYFVTLFPKLSESFVFNEVAQMHRRGLSVFPICFDRSARLEPGMAALARREGIEPVLYTFDRFPIRQFEALARLLLASPLSVLRLLLMNFQHPAPRGENRFARFVASLVALDAVRRGEIEHIHAHWSYPCDVALFVSRLTGVTFSFTVHAHDIFEDIELYARSGFSFGERAENAQFVLTCTSFNRDELRTLLGEDGPPVRHVYHGLDLDRWKPRAAESDAQGPPVFISVGRFVPYKGFDVIVRALGRLHRNGIDFRCYLVGPEGSQTGPVRELVKDLRLEDRVLLLGPRSQDQLVELYREATLFLNGSNPDGEFGVANVIVEALAAGIPAIVTNRTHVLEYIQDGGNGLLYPYGDDEALAQLIMRLLADPDERRRLGEAGRRTAVQQFSLDEAGERISGFLRDALDGTSSASR